MTRYVKWLENPTGQLTILDPQNPAVDVSELQKFVHTRISRLQYCEIFGQEVSKAGWQERPYHWVVNVSVSYYLSSYCPISFLASVKFPRFSLDQFWKRTENWTISKRDIFLTGVKLLLRLLCDSCQNTGIYYDQSRLCLSPENTIPINPIIFKFNNTKKWATVLFSCNHIVYLCTYLVIWIYLLMQSISFYS